MDLRACDLGKLDVSREQGEQTGGFLAECSVLYVVQIDGMVYRAKGQNK
jgi:hypothetical protein